MLGRGLGLLEVAVNPERIFIQTMIMTYKQPRKLHACHRAVPGHITQCLVLARTLLYLRLNFYSSPDKKCTAGMLYYDSL